MVRIQASPEIQLTIRRVSRGPDFEVEYEPRKDGRQHNVELDYLGRFEVGVCVPDGESVIQGSHVEFENLPDRYEGIEVVDETGEIGNPETGRLQLFPWDGPYEVNFGLNLEYYLKLRSLLPEEAVAG